MSYYGGKQRLASRIVSMLPPHTVYVEPFCGGASVLFAKPKPVPSNSNHYREVLNDYDQRIITVYRVCQQQSTRQELLDRLEYTPYSRDEFAKALEIIRDTWHATTDITRAWAVLIGIQQGFNHMIDGGWRVSVYGPNHAFTWKSWRDTLAALMNRLEYVNLECDDALAVIRRWDSPQTVFYCDPPYVGADQGRYAGYTEDDFVALLGLLQTCQSSVILSGYASNHIPPDWEQVKIEAHCFGSGKGLTHNQDRRRNVPVTEQGDRRRVEHLWRVDRSMNVRDELRPILWRHPSAAKTGQDLLLFIDSAAR